MFLLEEQLKGSINTVDRQLLYDIREEMRQTNLLLNKFLNGFNCEELKEENKQLTKKVQGGANKNKRGPAKRKKKEGVSNAGKV